MEKKTISISYDPTLILAILLAIALHLLLFTKVVSNKEFNQKRDKSRLVIKTVREPSPEIKVVGQNINTPNNAPLMSPSQQQSKTAPTLALPPKGNSQVQKQAEQLSLAQKMARILEAQSSRIPQKTVSKPTESKQTETSETKSIAPQRVSRKEIARYAGQSSASLPASPALSQLINRSDLVVQLQPPRGVKEDELNKEEQILYSFHKRIIEAYINGLVRTMLSYRSRFPYLSNFPFTGEKIELTAKVTFDVEGNIQQIKMIKWTNQEKIQDFFIEALDSMKSIPNPPKMLTKMDNEFVIYYGLTIDG